MSSPIYVPEFTCAHCGETKASQVSGDQGMFIPCDCKESRDAWEREHRATMERRKKLRRPFPRKKRR